MIDKAEIQMTYDIIKSRHPLGIIPISSVYNITSDEIVDIVEACASSHKGAVTHAYKKGVPIIILKLENLIFYPDSFMYKGVEFSLYAMDEFLQKYLTNFLDDEQHSILTYVSDFFDQFMRNR